jgi:hypothetical protein
MNLQLCSNANEDTFPLPLHIKQRYGPFGFPEPAYTRRPHITSNLVMAFFRLHYESPRTFQD